MKKQFLVICLVLVSFVFANAQKPGVTNPTTRIEVQNEIQREQNVQRELKIQRTRRSFPIGPGRGTSISAEIRRHRNLIKDIYRTPTKQELAMLAPNKEDASRFSEFLKQSNTGIFKLVPDKGCFVAGKIVVLKPECEQYTLPGFGSAYSFRVATYRTPSVADLIYKDNKFTGGESLTQEIFVEIGDAALENVNLQTAAAKFLIDFDANADEQKFKKVADQLAVGIERNGFQYYSSLKVNNESTYILRSIAYEGKVLRSFDGGLYYNELDWDKRKDEIVAFRVVRKDADGSVTILWKRLKSQDAPELVIE